jgi:hypothetical protein
LRVLLVIRARSQVQEMTAVGQKLPVAMRGVLTLSEGCRWGWLDPRAVDQFADCGYPWLASYHWRNISVMALLRAWHWSLRTIPASAAPSFGNVPREVRLPRGDSFGDRGSSRLNWITSRFQCPSPLLKVFGFFRAHGAWLAVTIENLQRLSAPSVLEEHVFDCIPHVFSGDRGSYVAWKRALGSAIDVDPACLTVVGSAAIGCSLNPTKNLKPFDVGSDVDVAVVSNYHFTVA